MDERWVREVWTIFASLHMVLGQQKLRYYWGSLYLVSSYATSLIYFNSSTKPPRAFKQWHNNRLRSGYTWKGKVKTVVQQLYKCAFLAKRGTGTDKIRKILYHK